MFIIDVGEILDVIFVTLSTSFIFGNCASISAFLWDPVFNVLFNIPEGYTTLCSSPFAAALFSLYLAFIEISCVWINVVNIKPNLCLCNQFYSNFNRFISIFLFCIHEHTIESGQIPLTDFRGSEVREVSPEAARTEVSQEMMGAEISWEVTGTETHAQNKKRPNVTVHTQLKHKRKQSNWTVLDVIFSIVYCRWRLCRTEWTASTSWRVSPRVSSSRWEDSASSSWIRPTNRRPLDSTGSSSCASPSSASSSPSSCAGSSWEWSYREYQSLPVAKEVARR